MSEKLDNPLSPDGQVTTDRKITKPLMEKRRRARINSCLSQLKSILLSDADEKESGRFAKLEKADILEMTVKYLRNQHNSPINGQQTALYRAGFNKCMEELSTFLGVDDEQSTNLRLKLTEHLAQILGCLKDTGSKSEADRSKGSPGLHVSSSTDESTSVPVARLTESSGDLSSASQIRESPDGTTVSPEHVQSVPTGSNTILLHGMNSQSSRMRFGLCSDEFASRVPLSSYTTIPVLPTVVAPGQVLLLVPNSDGRGFHLPAFTASSLEPLQQMSASKDGNFNGAPIKLEQRNTSNLNDFSALQETKLLPLSVLEIGQKSCATSVKTETSRNENFESNFGATHKVQPNEKKSVSDSDQAQQSSPDVRILLNDCRIRNSGTEGNSFNSNCSMWRPW